MPASQAGRRGFDPRLPLHSRDGAISATIPHGGANSTTTTGTDFPSSFNPDLCPALRGPALSDGDRESGKEAGREKATDGSGGLPGALTVNELQAVTDTASDSGGQSAARAAKTPRRALDRPSGGSGSETSGNARARTGTPAAACATFPLGVRSSHAEKSGAHSPPPKTGRRQRPNNPLTAPSPIWHGMS